MSVKTIWESIRTSLEKLFPFLFNAIEREWDNLPQVDKDALLKAGQFGQIVKLELSNGYDAIVKAAADELGMNIDQVNQLIVELEKKLNIDAHSPQDFIDKLQAYVNKGLEDSAWDNLFHSITSQLAIILSGGKFDWSTLALGLVQFVYEKFIAKKD